MIPKKIHYCWFGGGEFSPLIKECMKTWEEQLPDYEIKVWNEDNIPLDNEYVNKMLKEKKYAFASDYIRFYALYTEGGIYLDTDMEVVQSFNDLLNQKCFLGYESKEYISAGIIGGVQKFYFFEMIMKAIELNYIETREVETIPKIITKVMKEKNLFNKDITLYSEEYFYPYNPYDKSKKVSILMSKDITENTYAIHHWNLSWFIPKTFSQLVLGKITKYFKS